MTDDPYAGLPPEYLQLLREKEAEQHTDSRGDLAPDQHRGPTPEEEEEMDRYYGRASWLEHSDRRPTGESREVWHPPAIGDGI